VNETLPAASSDGNSRQGRRRLRRVVGAFCVITAVLALLPCTARNWSPLAVLSLSPLVAMASVFATRTLRIALIGGLSVAIVAIMRRRWFCHWMCPTGRCLDEASRIGLRFGRRCPRLPLFGPWILWICLGGAMLGYPAILWLDPLAIFGGMFSIAPAYLPTRQIAAWASAAILPVLLILSVLLPGAWCGKACPLGALQDFLYHLFRTVTPSYTSAGSVSLPERRRLLMRFLVGSMAGAAWAATARAMRGDVPKVLRPPGARDDTTFSGLCVRCGNCVRACPSRIIRQDTAEHGFAGLCAPVLRFDENYCLETCIRCVEVCPSGALTGHSITEKQRMRIGTPRVNMDLCLLGNDRDCAACRNRCPYEAITLQFSEVDYTLVPIIDVEKCSGCGACEVACPTKPMKAIVVHPTLLMNCSAAN